MNEDSRPIPDPTVLTTQQLLRELGASRELTDQQIESLRVLLGERIASLDLRVEQRFSLNDKALEAAFAARETTAAKSDESTTKQLEALGAKVDDLKDRVTGSESVRSGGREAYSGLVVFAAALFGAIGVIVAIVALTTRP